MGSHHPRRPRHPALALAALSLLAACGGEVPVLMFHSVGDGQDAFSVSPDQLEQHLEYLDSAGFHTVSLRQVMDHEEGHGSLPSRPIVLSFDDGYADAYARALPALQRHRMTATFFIVSGFLASDPSARQTDPATGRTFLTWDEALALRDAGMEIGSHTVRHGSLSHLGRAALKYEVEASKRTLEERLGQPVQFFAYPFTQQKVRVRKAVQMAGYRGAVVGPRGGLDRYELQRIVIHRWTTTDDLAAFLAVPWGAR